MAVWMYRDGESRLFDSAEAVPTGEGWVDSPAKVGSTPAPVEIKPEIEASAEIPAPISEPEQDDEMKSMLELAEEVGLKVDKRWGRDRLREELKRAMADGNSA